MKQVGVVLLGFITAAMHGQTAGSLAAAKAACGAGDPKYSVKTIPSKIVSGVDEGKAQLTFSKCRTTLRSVRWVVER